MAWCGYHGIRLILQVSGDENSTIITVCGLGVIGCFVSLLYVLDVVDLPTINSPIVIVLMS